MNRKNKIKALYGYWTHFLCSCSVETFENYVNTRKELPALHIDDVLKPHLRTSTSDLCDHKYTGSTLTHSHTYSEIENLEHDLNKNTDHSRQKHQNSLSDTTHGEFFELWRASVMPDRYQDYYNFNCFAMCLNEMKNEYIDLIPPTDTRHRNDIRFLENGDLDAAALEKARLEEKQRESRKNLKDEVKPRWFQLSKNPVNGEETWLFTEKYWFRDYKDCPNLY